MLYENETPLIPNAASQSQFQFVCETSFAPAKGQGRPSKTGAKGRPIWSSAHVLEKALRYFDLCISDKLVNELSPVVLLTRREG